MWISTLLKLLFLIGFTIHNIEEGIWLPEWSKYAEKFHKPVKKEIFRTALIVLTLFSYLLFFAEYLFPQILVLRYMVLGFIGMMALNVFFPHLIATIALRRYAPGLLTGFIFNLPISYVILFNSVKTGLNIWFIALSTFVVSLLTILFLNIWFHIKN